MIKFKIDGKPQAKQSVKFAHVGKFIRKYTPKEMVNYANWVKQSFKIAYPDHLPSVFYEKPLNVRIIVNVEIPKSFSQKKRAAAISGSIIPITKPDCDNIAKNICDALNGLAYPDDKQIARLVVEKVYNTSPYVVLEIYELAKATNQDESNQTNLFKEEN